MTDFFSTLCMTLTLWEVWVTIGLFAIAVAALPKTQKQLDEADGAFRYLAGCLSKWLGGNG